MSKAFIVYRLTNLKGYKSFSVFLAVLTDFEWLHFMTLWFFFVNSAILCYDHISVSEKLEKSVSIFLITLNYKLRIEKKRKNKRHQMVSKTDKTFFFLIT